MPLCERLSVMVGIRGEFVGPRSISARSPIVRDAAVLALAAAVLALTGCGTESASNADGPTVRPEEMTGEDGQPCPKELPTGDDPSGHGFGVVRAAEHLPSLPEPQEAWVCRYDTFDREVAPSGSTAYGWRLTGEPEPVAPGDLPALHDALGELTLPGPDQACTAELGPRWMVVYTHDDGLTGVVVDGYGCRDVRLTDNPHTIAPGADDQDRAVGGVLDGGAAVLDALGLGRVD